MDPLFNGGERETTKKNHMKYCTSALRDGNLELIIGERKYIHTYACKKTGWILKYEFFPF